MITILFFVFGLLIGSFLNVLIIRLPKKENWVSQRSACVHCGFQLKWYHNIPLVSYLALRGKCSSCNARISMQYPLIELLTGLAAILLMPDYVSSDSLMIFSFYFAVFSIFLCHLVIDIRHHLLLDGLNLYLLGLFLLFAVLNYHWKQYVLGGAIGFFIPLGVTWAFYKLRGQIGLGGGDIKLYGILGIFLGPLGVVLNIFLSCTLGAIIGLTLIIVGKMNRNTPMPFGPSILAVAAFQIFFPEESQILRKFLLGY